ncbi:MAG: [protein-PII] uridylyltransferase [Gammaproteobacteria bacterium]
MLPENQLFDDVRFANTLRRAQNPLTLFKQTLASGHALLNEAFLAGTPVKELVFKRAWFIDQLLVQAWRQILASDQLALVAVGGYGRGELLPASDIDLMILIGTKISKPEKKLIEQFLAFLWDIGLEVGHSVRSIRDCVKEAGKDITVATNLIESRFLTGNRELFENMVRMTGPGKIWPTKKYFEAKLREQTERYYKFDDTEHKLEPNIKEGPGGLRDIQMIGWVAKRHFGAATLKDLVTHEFLTVEEYKILDAGQSLLWRIRYGLHLITRRREDRLLFDYQRQLAQMFGFTAPDNSGVEQFMKMYYRTVRELNILNEILLQHFQEVIIYAGRREKIQPLNRRFQVRNDFLEVCNNNVFTRFPFALLEMFLLLQQNPAIKGVRASTIRLVRKHTFLIDRGFINDLRNRSLFMEIIRQPRHVGHELRRMHRYGILGRYLPVFGAVEGLMQFDLFHIYTVDEHILAVVRNLRLFTMDKPAADYPPYHNIAATLPKLELLYLGGLFHDIAKGRGGDHSTLGAADAVNFCKLHGLSDYDARLVAWLVEYHLLMSKTAQRMDITDPDVINRFAQSMSDRNHLNYLYLLTVADIRGTNPAIWNRWKETLLAELYQKTLYALRRGLEKPIDMEALITQTKNSALELLRKQRKLKFDIEHFWEGLGTEYFLRHSPDEIAWHTLAVSKIHSYREPLVVVRDETSRGGTEVFIYMKNQDNIFAASTWTLDRLGLNIVDARILTSISDFTLDTYIVLEKSGKTISGEERREEIIRALQQSLAVVAEYPKKINRVRPRQLKQFTIPTTVNFSADEKNNRTIMEVSGADRPGFLAKVGMALTFCGVRVQGAKIATYGARIEDIFFITDKNDRMVTDPITCECLTHTISTTLDAA